MTKEEARKEFLEACKIGNLEVIKQMLRKYPSFIKPSSTSYGWGYSRPSRYLCPLYIACINGRVETVKFLLEAGADPNQHFHEFERGDRCPDLEWDWYLLDHITKQGPFAVIKLLLEYGADTSKYLVVQNAWEWAEKQATEKDNKIVLLLASAVGKTERVRQLLQTDLKDDYKSCKAAYTYADRFGHPETAKLLAIYVAKHKSWLSKWASKQLQTLEEYLKPALKPTPEATAKPTKAEEDYDALTAASRQGQTETVKRLLEKGVSPNYHRNSEPLVAACICGRKEIVPLLLAAGADPNRYGYSPALIAACAHGRKEIVPLLLAAGAKVNAASPSGQFPLVSAVESGSLPIVSLLLEAGADVHAQEDESLLAACSNGGQTEMVKLLLQAGANPNRNDYSPALIAACKSGKKEIVSLLLEANANVNGTDPNKNYPLLQAIQRESRQIVPLLLDHGAKPTLNHILESIHNGEYKMAVQLIQAVAASDKKRLNKPSLLSAVFLSGNVQMIEALVKAGGDVNFANNHGETPLMWATNNGHLALLKLLLEAGADVNKVNRRGFTALMWACDRNGISSQFIEQLLKAGADVNATNKNGQTALMLASRSQNPAAVKALLEAKADVDIQDNDGDTALMYACRVGTQSTVKLLLEAGAKLHARNKKKFTPPLIAIEHKNWELLDILSPGVKTDIKDFATVLQTDVWIWDEFCFEMLKFLLSAHYPTEDIVGILKPLKSRLPDVLDEAIRKNNAEVVDVLLKAGAPTDKIYWGLVAQGDKKILDLLLRANARINASDENGLEQLLEHKYDKESLVELIRPGKDDMNRTDAEGLTSLTRAVKKHKLDVVDVLIQAGADVNATDKKHAETALMWACREGNSKSIKMLLAAKANVNLKDQMGRTALIWACEAEQQTAVELLLQAGADVTIADKNGITALQAAQERGYKELVTLLKAAGAKG